MCTAPRSVPSTHVGAVQRTKRMFSNNGVPLQICACAITQNKARIHEASRTVEQTTQKSHRNFTYLSLINCIRISCLLLFCFTLHNNGTSPVLSFWYFYLKIYRSGSAEEIVPTALVLIRTFIPGNSYKIQMVHA